MRRVTGGLLALTALVAVGVNDISGQQQGRRRGAETRPSQGVEAIMQMRERLALTDEQIASLDAVRGEAVQRRSSNAAEMAELRSQLSAGQIQRSDMMAFMEDQREASVGVTEAQRTRLESILSEEQQASMQKLRTRARSFARGRASARRDGRAGVGRAGTGRTSGPEQAARAGLAARGGQRVRAGVRNGPARPGFRGGRARRGGG
jgi:hypothetical protein